MTFAAAAAIAALVRGPISDTGMIVALFSLGKQQMEAVTARIAAIANSTRT